MTDQHQQPPGPLAGVRVLDLTSVVMGPLATAIMGDLGADVIVVEHGTGDTNRGMGPGPHTGLSAIALTVLRNKRSIALDLKTPAGRELLLRVAATCDVVVTNLRPGPLRRLGFGYDQVRAVNERIIFCQAQGFATDGPRADDPAYDDVIQAASGMTDVMRRAGGVDVPMMIPTLLVDKVCGLTIAYAVAAALFHRERTGEGQAIEVPMIDVATAFLLVEHGGAAIARTDGRPGGTAGYPRIITPDRRPQRTADGWASIFPYTKEQTDALLREGGVEPDPTVTYSADPGSLYRLLETITPQKTTAEWLTFCEARGIPASVSVDLDDVVEALPDGEHPVAGRYKTVPPPVRFSATPASLRRHAPLVGQQTREVLTEIGLDEGELARYTATGAIRLD